MTALCSFSAFETLKKKEQQKKRRRVIALFGNNFLFC